MVLSVRPSEGLPVLADNPLLVVGVHTKEIAYDRYPRMPDTSWAERAYSCGALDPSLGQAISFPSFYS